jgi:hypothetical protein
VQTPNPARAVESPATPAADRKAQFLELAKRYKRVNHALVLAAMYAPDGSRETALGIVLEFCEHAPATMTIAEAAKWLRVMRELP